jgi:hypothetical protein
MFCLGARKGLQTADLKGFSSKSASESSRGWLITVIVFKLSKILVSKN